MEIIIEHLLRHPKDDISIEEIATTTSITQNDVMWTSVGYVCSPNRN